MRYTAIVTKQQQQQQLGKVVKIPLYTCHITFFG